MQKFYVVRLLTGSSLMVCTLFALGCNQQSAQDAAKAVQDAGQAAGEAAEEAVGAAGDAAKQAMDSLGAEFTAAMDQASSALEGIEGGSEMLTQLKDLFGSLQSTLQGVTDSASAEAAVSKLDELSGSLEGLSSQAAELPSEAATAVKALIAQGIEQLKALADKALALPGVQETLKPKLDEMMEKLQQLVG